MSYGQGRSGSIGAMGGVAITDGRNCTVRLYRPRAEILDGTRSIATLVPSR
jgi:hypothetical protein